MDRATFFKQFELLADMPNAVTKMRELVLQLAFSGGLSGKIRSDDEIPEGWEKRTIESIMSSITPGFACSRTHQVDGGHVHLRTHNISTLGTLNFDLLVRIDPKMVDPQKSSISAGDILFNNTNSQELVGKTSLVNRNYNYGFSNHITRLRLKDDVFPGFVVFYLTMLRNSGYFARLCTRWINQAAVNTDTLKEQTIPLPPLAEQRRIVAKVTELMGLCDELAARQQAQREARARLTQSAFTHLTSAKDEKAFRHHAGFLLQHSAIAFDDVAQLRQTILQLAVQGRLVRQDPKDEPAELLLKRLRKKYEAKRNASVEVQKPFELPTRWAWARFPELGEFARGKSRHRPRNDPALYAGGKYPLVQTGDVARSNGIIRTHTGLYNDVGLAQSRLWPIGTVCITIAANIAETGILGIKACIPDSVVGFVPDDELGNANYFEYFMRTAKKHLQDFAPSTAQQNINMGILEAVLIPLPPLAEQKRIVAKVGELLRLCDELEGRLQQSRTVGEQLLAATVQQLLAA